MHRFYVDDENLNDVFEMRDKAMVWQWNKVLRFHTGQQMILFNNAQKEAEYSIISISKSSVNLQKLYDVKPKITDRQLYLFWSLLKRDNNELVLQKCTEIGVTHFVPLITERTIKKDFNQERAQKIIIEASEQCGRADIPSISKPFTAEEAIKEYAKKMELFIADQSGQFHNYQISMSRAAGVVVGPEGGWTENEHELFKNYKLKKMKISQFILRAETAAIVAASKLL